MKGERKWDQKKKNSQIVVGDEAVDELREKLLGELGSRSEAAAGL